MAVNPEVVHTLMSRLEMLEALRPRPEERAIVEVARRAILDEIRRQVQADGLWLYRHGSRLDVVLPG